MSVETMIKVVAQRVIDHAEELTRLDQAIGDGDHGINMKRGCEAVLAELPALSGQPLPDAVKAVGTRLVMTVGGASGPLYGTLFMSLGRALPPAPSRGTTRRQSRSPSLLVARLRLEQPVRDLR